MPSTTKKRKRDDGNSTASTRRKVDVVTFVDPTIRKPSAAQNALMKHKLNSKYTSSNEKTLSLKDAAGDVLALAVTGYTRKQKKIHDNEYIRSLKGKVKAKATAPLKMMFGLERAAKKRDKKKRRFEKVSGIITNDGKVIKNKPKARKKFGDSLSTIRKTGFKNGVMTVKK